jgi:hypothetical protein
MKIIVDAQTGEVRHVPLTAEEEAEREAFNRDVLPGMQWEDIRRKRRDLLAETDWMANSDVTMSDEWRAYRQALRDLPANTTDPANPVWPTKPE